MINETNDATYWREFERSPVSHSAAHYLKAIDTLRDAQGYARATDVAGRLEVSRGAASMAIAQLKKRAWVDEDPNRFLVLTPKGHRMAHQLEHNFDILSQLFEDVLGVSHKVARADACKMEHLMSSQTGRRLVWLMRYILEDETRSAAVHHAMDCFRSGCEAEEDCPLFDTHETPPLSEECPNPKKSARRRKTNQNTSGKQA